MVTFIVKENTKQAKLMIEYLKSLPYVEIVENKKIPNKTTLKALQEAEKGNLKRFKNVKDLMKDLNS